MLNRLLQEYLIAYYHFKILHEAMSQFRLHKDFAKKSFIIDLPLSRVLLNNSKHIPWVFLVPRINDIIQINNLKIDDQFQLMKEINFVSNIMENTFECNRLNVAAIGNKTEQLHVHIICRTVNDPYWPETVWQYSCEEMNDDDLETRVLLLRAKFGKSNL